MGNYSYEETLKMIRNGKISLKDVDVSLRRDKDIILAAIEKDGMNLIYANDCHDKEIVLAAVRKDGRALNYAGRELRDDEEIVRTALQTEVKLGFLANKSSPLQYAGTKCKGNKEIVLLSQKSSCYDDGFKYATDEIKNNEEIVRMAVDNNGLVLEHVNPRFLGDKKVVEIAVKSDGYAADIATLKEERAYSKRRIEAALKERKIDCFVHFTNVKNLSSITRYGLIPRQTMVERDIPFVQSDGKRYDGINGTSLSVSFPNCEMFGVKQRSLEEWCVLLISPMRVLQKECLFFAHNAATSCYSSNKTNKCRFIDFESMFSKKLTVEGKGTRTRTFDKKGEQFAKFATSPQAEIMCLEDLSPSCIKACVFKDEKTMRKYKSDIYNGINVMVDPWYFGDGPYSEEEESR